MKVSNTVVTAIVIAAALVFAYGIGLLIRQARTSPKSVPVEKTATAPQVDPRVARSKDTPEMRAKIKEERAKAIEKMNVATEEQKEEFRNQVSKRFGGRRGSKKLQNRPLPASQTPTAQPPSSPEAGPATQEANPPAAVGENTDTKSSTDQTGSGSGKAGPG